MTHKVAHIDLETFSEEDLKAAGVFRYAEHPSTEFYVLGYRFDDEKIVTLWMPFDNVPLDITDEVLRRCRDKYFGKYAVELLTQRAVPSDLHAHVVKGRDVNPNAPGGELRAHNAQFERVVLSGTAGKRVGFPKLTIEQFVCTAAKMAAHGMPRALGDSAEALGTHPKDESGRISMLQLAKPRKPTKADPSTRWTFQNAPEKYVEVLVYNVDDVLAECGVDDAVPDLIPPEQALYHFDQHINVRGVRADLEGVYNILAVVDEYKNFLSISCEKATRPPFDPLLDLAPLQGLKPTQRDKIAEWVRANGYPQLLDMQAETVKDIIKDPAVPAAVKHVLRIYSTYNAKAITKLNAILNAVCADGRLRGMFLFYGAGTGRWSALIVQLHNLFRPVIDDPETAVEAFSARNLEWIQSLYPGVDPIKVASSCVRSVLIADDDKDLLFPDFAGIESRTNAWIFDEEKVLEAFRAYDTVLKDENGVPRRNEKGEVLRAGPDNYKTTYANAFGIKAEDVTKDKRQVGKVFDLAFGFEGGANACVNAADTYHIDLDELTAAVLPVIPPKIRESAEWMWNEMPQHRAGLTHNQFIACDSLKRLWRSSRAKTVQGWKDLKAAAESAVRYPGKGFAIPNGKVAFKVVEYKGRSWLYMQLPSKRRLAFFKPRWIEEKKVSTVDEHGVQYERIIPGEMRYWDVDTDTRRWLEVSTYGGKLCENAVQATAREFLVNAMIKLEAAGYPIVGHVHDEPIAEIPKNFGSMEEAGWLMCDVPAWAAGMPIAVEGHRQKRYRK